MDFISGEREGGGGKKPAHNTNTPKIGHVECCWSPPQGGPCSVHLTVCQLLMRASEWTSGGCTAALSACFSTVAVNLNILLPPSSGAASPLTRFRPPLVTQWSLPPQPPSSWGFKSCLAWQNQFLSCGKKWHVKNSKCWKHALGVATSRWGSGRFTARMAAKGAGYCQRPVCCLCGWQEIKAVCGREWVLCQKKKVMRKITGRLLIACFFFCVFQQVNKQRKAIVQLILEKRELLVGHRVKRDGTSAVIYC